MAKRVLALILAFVCVCFLFVPCSAAESTLDALEPINLNRECLLTLSYRFDQISFENVDVKLYKVASVSTDFQYTLTEPFSSSGLSLNGIRTLAEWDVVCSTAEAYIVADNIKPDEVTKTDVEGLAYFSSLKPGLYLARMETVTKEEKIYSFDCSLVAVPGTRTDGKWQYQVTVNAKSSLISSGSKEVERKLIKLWKGDESKTDRPQSIEAEIFRDGNLFQKVLLSEENHWSFCWKTNLDGAKWAVIERNTPSGYTMTVEERELTFVLTNTRIPSDGNVPSTSGQGDGTPTPPQTGDTSNVMLYVILMVFSGSLLVILGLIGKRCQDDK